MTTTPSTRTGPLGIGIIGAGVISGTYIENLTSFADTKVVAIADKITEKAHARAEEFGIAAAGDNSVVLDNPEVELVVNITTPDAHAEVAAQALAAGKHVWNEKPLALDRESGRGTIEAAEAAGLRVGCAPDTFLGTGLQKSRELLESGIIGTPLTALVLLQSPGPESWHPDPAFLFQYGAGPLFDIGPYYLTALTQFFGPARKVAATASKARETRTIGSGPKAGEVFDVTVPSQYSALVQYESGQSATMIYSFDSAQTRTLLEITGTEGTMLVPDPNMFEGEIAVRRFGEDDFTVVAETTAQSSRGTGALDIARAIREGRPHRAQGTQAFHVLDTMVAIAESGERGEFVSVDSTFEKPALLPEDWDPKAATV